MCATSCSNVLSIALNSIKENLSRKNSALLGGGGGAARRGPGREGRGTSFSSVYTHRIAPHPEASLGLSRVPRVPWPPVPSGGGIPESLAHLFKAAATTSASRSAPPVTLPRLPRPRSLQPLANRYAISEEVPALLIALPNPSTAA